MSRIAQSTLPFDGILTRIVARTENTSAGSSAISQSEQGADVRVSFKRMAQRGPLVDLVLVSTPSTALRQDVRRDKVGNDLLNCSFGDADSGGDVPHSRFRVAREANEHMGVVA